MRTNESCIFSNSLLEAHTRRPVSENVGVTIWEERDYRRWFWVSQKSWKFMEWYCLQLSYGNGCGDGALMCTCMQSIALVLGRPAMVWSPSLDWDLFCCCVVEFDVLCSQLDWLMPVICPPCFLAPSEMYRWLKSPRWRLPAPVHVLKLRSTALAPNCRDAY